MIQRPTRLIASPLKNTPAQRHALVRHRLVPAVIAGLIVAGSALSISGCGRDDGAPSSADLDRPATEATGVVLGAIDGYVIDDAFVDAYARAIGVPREGLESTGREELVQISVLANAGRAAGLADDPRVRGEVRFRESLALASRYIEDFEAGVDVSEEALRAEYERQIADFGGQEYRARHILVESEDDAQTLIDALNSDGDFAALAREHSRDGSASRGGDLGWFTLDRMVPEFSEALAELEPGQFTTAPVQSRFGWHVIQLDELRDREPPAFDDLREALRDRLVADALDEHVEALQRDATVEWTDR